METRHNGLFYRNSNKSENIPTLNESTEIELDLLSVPAAPSSKILVCAYKELMQHFNQLDAKFKKNWQPEINIVARQLAQIFKQMVKNTAPATGYPALNLLREIRQLDKRLITTHEELSQVN